MQKRIIVVIKFTSFNNELQIINILIRNVHFSHTRKTKFYKNIE